MSTSTTVSEEEMPTAQSFLDALQISTHWTPNALWSCPWVFRGQRDSRWSLTPAAWRNGKTVPLQRLARLKQQFAEQYGQRVTSELARDPRESGANTQYVVESYAQARAEFTVILEFVKLADELGHPVPGMDTYLRLANHDYLPDVSNYPLVRFLPEPNSATALAQHHGIPTRSQDWTRNPLIAAFFAANEVEAADQSGSIAVWAIRPDYLQSQGRAEQHNVGYTRFMDHSAPNSQNQYLHAQEGLFIHPTYGCAHYANSGQWPNLETFAVAVAQELSEPTIRKLTLPYAQVGELIRLLWLNGISRAHLMPTLDNVTHALCSRWQWMA
jgi:hypothetical protein